MFQYASNSVAVQNDSWGNAGVALDGPSLLEQIGISNAITQGRNGRGVIMVRSAGKFPETEWITPCTSSVPQFFQVRAVAAP